MVILKGFRDKLWRQTQNLTLKPLKNVYGFTTPLTYWIMWLIDPAKGPRCKYFGPQENMYTAGNMWSATIQIHPKLREVLVKVGQSRSFWSSRRSWISLTVLPEGTLYVPTRLASEYWMQWAKRTEEFGMCWMLLLQPYTYNIRHGLSYNWVCPLCSWSLEGLIIRYAWKRITHTCGNHFYYCAASLLQAKFQKSKVSLQKIHKWSCAVSKTCVCTNPVLFTRSLPCTSLEEAFWFP